MQSPEGNQVLNLAAEVKEEAPTWNTFGTKYLEPA